MGAVRGGDRERQAHLMADGATAHQARIGEPLTATASPASGARIPLSGIPLGPSLLGRMQTRLGVELSQVRVHEGPEAERATREQSAAAYTVGTHVVLGAAGTGAAREATLVHELTHVVQQRRDGRVGLDRQDHDAAVPAATSPAMQAEYRRTVTQARDEAGQNDDLGLRAYGTRAHLLLTFRTPPVGDATLDAFIDDSLHRAATEVDTLDAFSAAAQDGALALFPAGFPLTWAGRIHASLTLGADMQVLLEAWRRDQVEFGQAAVALVPGLVDQGLPVPADNLARLRRFHLRMGDSSSPTAAGAFARQGIRHQRLRWVVAFMFTWERTAGEVADAVREGRVIANDANWRAFTRDKEVILRSLPQRAEALLAATETDLGAFSRQTLDLADGALLAGFTASFAALVSILSGWSEVAETFDNALGEADTRIAAADLGDRFLHALTYAWENGYFGAALDGQVRSLIAAGPYLLAGLAAVLIAQAIPGVNVGLDVVLLLMLGWSIVSLLDDLAQALTDVLRASSVARLQLAAHALAGVLARGGIEVALALLTWGGSRAVSRVRARAVELRSAEPGLSPTVAQQRALSELSGAERATLESGEVAQARRLQEAASRPSGVPNVHGPAAPVTGDPLAGVNAETLTMLRSRPQLRSALQSSPRAARALRKCASPCFPEFATPTQIDRLERMIKAMDDAGGVFEQQALTNYLRSQRTAVELDLALDVLARQVEARLGVAGAFSEAQRSGMVQPGAGTRGLQPSVTEGVRTTVLRNRPGTASGGQRLPEAGQEWLASRGATDRRVARIPGQVARRLRGRSFNSFDGLREEFWRLIAREPDLARHFDYYPVNLGRMREGLAPFAPPARVAGRVESVGRGSNAVYQLNHVRAVEHGGGVYNLDNLELVTPRFHREIGQ